MKHFAKSRTPYLVVTALALGALGQNVLATNSNTNRYETSNGVPADIMNTLWDIQAQVADLQGTVDDFEAYVRGNTSDVLDINGQLCFSAALGLGANVGLGANGTLDVGVGTGLDIYGLIDLDARGDLQAALDLAAQLDAGITGNAQICINMGILKLKDDGTIDTPFGSTGVAGLVADEAGVADSLAALVGEGQDAFTDVYNRLPDLLAELEVGPDSLSPALDAVESFVASPPHSAADFVNPGTWQTIADGLPGSGIIYAAAGRLYEPVAALQGGDVCGFLDSFGGLISGSVGSALGSSCQFVANTGVDTLSSAAQNIYHNVNSVIGSISGVVGSIWNYVQTVKDAVCSLADC